jgi:hypothetical protein
MLVDLQKFLQRIVPAFAVTLSLSLPVALAAAFLLLLPAPFRCLR